MEEGDMELLTKWMGKERLEGAKKLNLKLIYKGSVDGFSYD